MRPDTSSYDLVRCDNSDWIWSIDDSWLERIVTCSSLWVANSDSRSLSVFSKTSGEEVCVLLFSVNDCFISSTLVVNSVIVASFSSANVS